MNSSLKWQCYLLKSLNFAKAKMGISNFTFSTETYYLERFFKSWFFSTIGCYGAYSHHALYEAKFAILLGVVYSTRRRNTATTLGQIIIKWQNHKQNKMILDNVFISIPFQGGWLNSLVLLLEESRGFSWSSPLFQLKINKYEMWWKFAIMKWFENIYTTI